uniref:RBR-type E3 ubiquitin transferase n=1 Tax=Amphilophus citrinellus TaxID=61819 RepID=A0A3Q0QYE2_AMPCI
MQFLSWLQNAGPALYPLEDIQVCVESLSLTCVSLQYGRYLQYGAEECLLTIGGLMCPSPGCGAGLLPPDNSRKVKCDQQLGCGFIFCRVCRGEYHEGPCQVLTAPPTHLCSLLRSQPGAAQHVWFLWRETVSVRYHMCWLSCDMTDSLSPPAGGCMHMQCPLCKAEWCWLCGVPWNRECMGNHWDV